MPGFIVQHSKSIPQHKTFTHIIIPVPTIQTLKYDLQYINVYLNAGKIIIISKGSL